ncbi:putative Ubiquitin-like domain-containing protein [Helianthus annuus]|uniref:Ubiquitin domain-containing protein n=2 Tax=Helianthus annuus TaxID=4232 RepID=A0A9K3IWT0_HELAN|nr:putative Ubiquitin domain-containing protein [Helianthus annuus]KAJ0917321.1 putative Ubiquitin-like domain-containing protein [Helianthus annuus]
MQLLIETSTGNTFTMMVEGSDTFDLVKAKIEEQCGRRLDNYCNIHWELVPPEPEPEPELDLVQWSKYLRPGAMQIFVRINNEKKTITLKPLFPDSTIFDLMDMIKEKTRIHNFDQNLFLVGMPLDYRGTIASNNIHWGSIVDIVEGPSLPWGEIYVETIQGKTITLKPEEDLGVIQVKAFIQDQAGIPTEQQRLVYAGDELDNDRYMSSYYIRNQSTLRLVDEAFKRIRVPMGIRICIDDDDDATQQRRNIYLVVESTDTIHVVKAKIQNVEGIPADRQVLFLPHKRLDDSFTLADYYFQEGTTLYLSCSKSSC